MRKLLQGLLGILFVAPLLFASEVQNANFAFDYDVDSASLTYVRMVGQGGNPFGGAMAGPGTIKTTGSSATVVENVASSNPFTNIEVGDVIQVSTSTNARDTRVVIAKATAASITVDSVVDWSAGYSWRWWDTQKGTTSADGWIDVGGADSIIMTMQYDQGDLDALTVRWECKSASLGSNPVIAYPGEASDCGIGGTLSTDRCSFATAGVTARLSVMIESNPFSACRVGLAYAAADASDAGANLEKVTVTLSTTRLK